MLDFFERERPYLQPELTLSELAAQMQTNHSVLSQVIKAGFGVNFNDFMSGYWVAASCHGVLSPSNTKTVCAPSSADFSEQEMPQERSCALRRSASEVR